MSDESVGGSPFMGLVSLHPILLLVFRENQSQRGGKAKICVVWKQGILVTVWVLEQTS